MALKFAQDVNGDGKMNLEDGDRFGIIGEAYNTDVLLQACGIKIARYENNDLIFIGDDKGHLDKAASVLKEYIPWLRIRL